MPYASDKQRKYMHAQHPEIAAKWDEEIRAAKKRRVVKPLDDEGLSRAYKRQKHFTYTTSTLGLTGLGMLGASVAAKKLPVGAARSVHMNAERSEKIRRAGQNVGITAGGIGGLAGINWARIADAESRRIKKSNYGEGYDNWRKKQPFTISDKAADPERSRKRRAAAYPFLMGAGAGASGTLTVREALKPKADMAGLKLDEKLLRSKSGRIAAGTALTGGLVAGAAYHSKSNNRRSYDSWYPQRERVSKSLPSALRDGSKYGHTFGVRSRIDANELGRTAAKHTAIARRELADGKTINGQFREREVKQLKRLGEVARRNSRQRGI